MGEMVASTASAPWQFATMQYNHHVRCTVYFGFMSQLDNPNIKLTICINLYCQLGPEKTTGEGPR